MTLNINVDNRTIVRILAVTFLFLFTVSFLSATRHAITLVIISAFFAMALNPPVSYFSSKITGGSRGAATAISYLLVLSIIGLFAWAIVPPLVQQSRQFINDLPSIIDEAAASDNAIGSFIRDNDIDIEIQEFVDDIRSGQGITSNSSQLFSSLGRVGSGLASLLTVLVLTYFMLIEGPEWLKRFWAMHPESERERRRNLGYRMYQVITGYVNGQLLVALLAAMTSLIVMLIVGLPLPLPLAGVVGLFGLLPLVGATLGSIVVIIVALFQSVASAIIMLIFFLVYQQIENNFIQPYVQSRTLDVSPLLVFLAVIFGISLGGILGAFIAIPVAACIRILVVEYMQRRTDAVKKKETSKNPVKKLIAAAKDKS